MKRLDMMDNVSDKLYKYLTDNKISQKSIADRLGVTEQNVNGLVNGRRHFGRKTAMMWEREFGISAKWLISGEGEMLVNGKANALYAFDDTPEVVSEPEQQYNSSNIIYLQEKIKLLEEIIESKNQLIEELKKQLNK